MILLPKEINYFELYFTLKCNFHCPYCINSYSGLKRKREEIPIEKLAEKINNIGFGDIPFTIGGGEPTFRSGFYEFVENLRKDIKIDLLTNLQFDVEEFVKNIPIDRFYSGGSEAYKSIRISYHPSQTENPYVLVNKAKQLQDYGFKVGIFGISHPENTDANIMMSEIARKSEVYFFIKDFLGIYNDQIFGYYRDIKAIRGDKRNCQCRSYEILLDASGNVYKCHRDLYEQENEIGNLLDNGFKFDFIYRQCNNYGNCNPCDVKIKANRFLKMGKCSTDIILK